MGRRNKVDSLQAEKACHAVRSAGMSVRSAALAFGVSKTSISRRLSGEVAMDAKVGPRTVLTKDEEDELEDVLLHAAQNFMSFSRSELREGVRQMCNDGRTIPWDPDKGPGQNWTDGFLRRHPRLAGRGKFIYEADGPTKQHDKTRSKEKFLREVWGEYVEENNPKASHIHCLVETGEE